MGSLWTPPGADLGDFDGPTPDDRMQIFGGGFDEHGNMQPLTYKRMRAMADGWLITAATPEGPAGLLKAAKDMYALGFYSYELVACSGAWSIFGVEAALKLRFPGSGQVSFHARIQEATQAGLLDDALAEYIDTGRRLRNNLVHEGQQATWTLGMAGGVIGASFELVAHLFPDMVPGSSRS